MKIFIDSANVKDIEKWINYGIADGVTTNPSIMFKDGIYNIEEGVKKLAKLIDPRPLSAEVTTNDIKEMIEQAKWLASLAPNVVVKIPVENEFGVPCYGVISQLEKSGVKVNATAILSFGQIMLAAKADATYVSLFAGRIDDEGGNSTEVIADTVEWLESWDFKSRLIIGSIRSVGDVINAALAGAHIITVPPQQLDKMADHKYSRETVKQFIADAQSALKMMGKNNTT
jgi:transaldolase